MPERIKKQEPEHFHYDINYLFETDKNQFKISNESTKIKWCLPDEAKMLADPQNIGLLRMLEKYENFLNLNMIKKR